MANRNVQTQLRKKWLTPNGFRADQSVFHRKINETGGGALSKRLVFAFSEKRLRGLALVCGAAP